ISCKKDDNDYYYNMFFQIRTMIDNLEHKTEVNSFLHCAVGDGFPVENNRVVVNNPYKNLNESIRVSLNNTKYNEYFVNLPNNLIVLLKRVHIDKENNNAIKIYKELEIPVNIELSELSMCDFNISANIDDN